MHRQHVCLAFNLRFFFPELAPFLAAALREEFDEPLQTMAFSGDSEMTDFLTIGGFDMVRRTFAVEAVPADLMMTPDATQTVEKIPYGSPDYDMCCGMLYKYYRETHDPINPVTATEEEFAARLPRDVIVERHDGEIVHVAFVKGNEILYVVTVEPGTFKQFGANLAAYLFRDHDTIFFEADDCDETAMQLRSLFTITDDGSYNTYILSP